MLWIVRLYNTTRIEQMYTPKSLKWSGYELWYDQCDICQMKLRTDGQFHPMWASPNFWPADPYTVNHIIFYDASYAS